MKDKEKNNYANDQEECETKEELYITSSGLFMINYTFGFTIIQNTSVEVSIFIILVTLVSLIYVG